MGISTYDVVKANAYIGQPMVTSGQIFFVNNSTVVAPSAIGGSNGNRGTSPQAPFSTLQGAIDSATASRGDVIYVCPGHAETVTATNIAVNKAGLQIIGLGTGSLRPAFTFGAAAATITVSAANCSFSNCQFIANFQDVATAFTLTTATDFAVTSSDFVDTSAILNFLCCVTTDATNNHADGLKFSNNYVLSLPATDGAVVSVLGNVNRFTVSDNFVDKSATSDAGHLCTFSSKVITGAQISRNRLTMKALSSQSTGTLITGSSTTSSGMVSDNYVYQIDTSTGLLATTGQKFGYVQNFMTGAADASGSVFPAVDNPA